MEQVAEHSTQPNPNTPVVFVGDDKHDEQIVAIRIFVRCTFSTPERGSFPKLTALDEIPLMRKLYAQYGGSVKVISGLEHPTFGRFTLQKLNSYEFHNIITTLKRTYNNVLIQKRLHQFFDDVYGTGEHCVYIPKTRQIVEEWNGDLEAENVERILAKFFPHVATRSQDDILSIPGLDGLTEAPEVGSKAVTPKPGDMDIPMDTIVEPPMGDAVPDTQGEEERLQATMLLGDAAPDPELVAFLTDTEKTSGQPLLENQAWAVASLLLKKPHIDWDSQDYDGIPGLNKKNHPRISRYVDAFYKSQSGTDQGAEDEESDETSDVDDMLG